MGLANGSLTTAQANNQIVAAAASTSSVATLAYQFFTGSMPTEAGMYYLVSPTGPNRNNLNSPYYQAFGLENRYINFASNLGKTGGAGYGATGIGTKAAMIGWLMAEAVKADVGTYAHANDALLQDVAVNGSAVFGATQGVDLIGHYATPQMAYTGP